MVWNWRGGETRQAWEKLMTETATGEVVSVLESETSTRRDMERARRLAFCVPAEMRALKERLEEWEKSFKATRSAERKTRLGLSLGVAYWILGRCQEALDPLGEVASTPEGAYLKGCCLLELGRCEEAVKAFADAAAKGEDAFDTAMCIAEAQRRGGNLDAALEQVRACQAGNADRAELHYQKGRCLEERGEYEEAMEEMERACELDAEHARAAFRLAYLCELRGLDDLAMEYYEKCAEMKPTYANALLNLGVLCEDAGDYYRAVECYRRVLAADPMNARARLCVRDAEGSLAMYYDEESRKRSDRTNALLLTPVSDFELSVRSRNCLSKMNVRCLGDLVRLTEHDLLSFKNFGETSLNEIKEMLRVKGLRFGMKLEEGQPVSDVLSVPTPAQQDLLNRSIDDLDLSIRSKRAMETLGVKTLGDLCRYAEADLLECKNFGQTSLNEVVRKLAEKGLNLRTEGS